MYILIYSYSDDESVQEVIEWLHQKNQKVFFLCDKYPINIKEVRINKNTVNVFFEYDGKKLQTNLIKSFWYRKGKFFIEKNASDLSNSKEIIWYLTKEIKAVEEFLASELNNKSFVNNISNGELNKLIQIVSADRCGLKIPETILTKKKENLNLFLAKHINVVTKSIQVPFYFNDNKKAYYLYTSNFNEIDLKKTAEEFFVTKFQNQINKIFELRIFYINGSFYSMAIFSQNNEKTKIDFRNYDYDKPNRTVPFELPKLIKSKLKILMKNLRLNSGSIDMIVDPDYQYWFLEVNPVGQFGMVSKPCNYYIEEKIAKTLYRKSYD